MNAHHLKCCGMCMVTVLHILPTASASVAMGSWGFFSWYGGISKFSFMGQIAFTLAYTESSNSTTSLLPTRRKNDMRMNTRSRVRRVFGVKKMGETYIITELESTLSESTLSAYTTPWIPHCKVQSERVYFKIPPFNFVSEARGTLFRHNKIFSYLSVFLICSKRLNFSNFKN